MGGRGPYSLGTLLIGTDGDASTLVSEVRALSADMGTRISVYDASRLDRVIEDSTWAFGLFGTVFTVFGGVSLLLAAVGIYGITAFSVRQRRREMSLRMALGAPAERVMLMVLGEVGRRFAVGIATGLLAGVFVGRGIRAVLFGVEPLDPVVYAAVVVTIVATGLSASIGPALGAARAAPARVLGS